MRAESSDLLKNIVERRDISHTAYRAHGTGRQYTQGTGYREAVQNTTQ